MSRLETVTNIAVIFAAVVVIGNNLYGRLFPGAPRGELTLAREIGGKPLALPTPLPTGDRGTVAIFLSENCHYCRESISFYRHLASLISENSACDVKLVAVGPEGREKRESIQAYLAGQDLKLDGVDVVSFAGVGISSTPTLVLRDSSRVVRHVWVGLLSPSRQREVVARVRSLCQT